jgi:hypothetical protein
MRKALLANVRCIFAAFLAFSLMQVACAGSSYFTGTNSVWDNGATADWSLAGGGPYNHLWQTASDAHFEATPARFSRCFMAGDGAAEEGSIQI